MTNSVTNQKNAAVLLERSAYAIIVPSLEPLEKAAETAEALILTTERGLKCDAKHRRMPAISSGRKPLLIYGRSIEELVTAVLSAEPNLHYLLVLCAGYVITDRDYFDVLQTVATRHSNAAVLYDCDENPKAAGACLINLEAYIKAGRPRLELACLPIQNESFLLSVTQDLRPHRRCFDPFDLGTPGTPFEEFAAKIRRDVEAWKHCIFIFNTERIRKSEYPPVIPDCIVGLPSGFKTERLAFGVGATSSTEIIYYDFSPLPLAHRSEMLQQWDGRNFLDFNRSFKDRNSPEVRTSYAFPGPLPFEETGPLWREVLDSWGGEEEFADFWSRYRHFNFKFTLADIVASPEDLFRVLPTSGTVLLWISNIFQSAWTSTKYRLHEVEQHYISFLEKLEKHNNRIHVAGRDVFDADAGGRPVSEKLERALAIANGRTGSKR